MIDTLHIAIPVKRYRIRPDNALNISESLNKSTGELTRKRYHNSNETCKTGLNVTDYGAMLTISCSAPKLLYDTNLVEICDADLERFQDSVKSGLEKIGIESDLCGAYLTRVDTCRNVPIELPVSHYLHALQSCTIPYLSKSIIHKGSHGVETLTFTNPHRSMRDFQLYDKVQESGATHDGNILRLEYRNKVRKSVESEFHQKKVMLKAVWNQSARYETIKRILGKMQGKAQMMTSKCKDDIYKQGMIELMLQYNVNADEFCTRLLAQYQDKDRRWKATRAKQKLDLVKEAVKGTSTQDALEDLIRRCA